MLWASVDSISEHDMQQALFAARKASNRIPCSTAESVKGSDIEGVLGEVAAHYIERALKESGGQKTRAAELLGFKITRPSPTGRKNTGAG